MIVVNARFLTQKISGVQRVGIEVSKRLKKAGLDIVFVSPKNIIHHELAKELDAVTIGRFSSHLWEQIDLLAYLLKNKNPLLISFGGTGPLFYKNQIISIYDMGFKVHPHWFSKQLVFVYRIIIQFVSRRCKLIFTDSQDAKKDIVNLLGINQNKVEVLPLGIADIFLKKTETKPQPETGVGDLFEQRFLLTVSSHHPRKNFVKLVEAFNLLEDKDIKLYVIGNVVSHFSNKEQIIPDNLNERVILLKGITDDELVRFYKKAELFVYPSLFEGFGIPIIEAMSQGAECVISDIPVFREIFEESATYFDPTNAMSIAERINFTLKNPKSEIELDNILKTVSKKYSWDKCAEKVNNRINNILNEGF